MMKVPPSIRAHYENQLEQYQALQNRVGELIGSLKPTHWHYEGRVKELESYALKIESGRVPNPRALEDFFACTVVVRNAAEISGAEQLVEQHFSIRERRPPDQFQTRKRAHEFSFDDLRLYVNLKTLPHLPLTGLEDLKFEIQIKTFLQHAWSIATHDLIYKSADVQWAKSRIAFQIKAMLEHAELAIEKAEDLSTADLVARTDPSTSEIRYLIEVISERWPTERMPVDVKRLAENINSALRCLKIKKDQLATILDVETAAGRGTRLLDLSPYGAVLQSIFYQNWTALEEFVRRADERSRLTIPANVEAPEGETLPPASHRLIYI